MKLVVPQEDSKECAWVECGEYIYRPADISNHAWSITRYHHRCSPSRRGVIAMTKPKVAPPAQAPVIPDGITEDPRWRLRAACRDDDPELFFPLSDDKPNHAQIEISKEVCAACPVREQCLAFAFVAAEFGTFGGMTQWERERLLRRYPHLRESA